MKQFLTWVMAALLLTTSCAYRGPLKTPSQIEAAEAKKASDEAKKAAQEAKEKK